MKSPKSLSTIYICMECIWLSVWNGSKFIAIMYIYIWLFDRDRSWLDIFLDITQPYTTFSSSRHNHYTWHYYKSNTTTTRTYYYIDRTPLLIDSLNSSLSQKNKYEKHSISMDELLLYLWIFLLYIYLYGLDELLLKCMATLLVYISDLCIEIWKRLLN